LTSDPFSKRPLHKSLYSKKKSILGPCHFSPYADKRERDFVEELPAIVILMDAVVYMILHEANMIIQEFLKLKTSES
jgi:hypothetical protein